MSVALMKLSPAVATGVMIALELEPGDVAGVSAGELFIVGMRAKGSNFGKSADATLACSGGDADVCAGSAADDAGVELGSVDGVAAGVPIGAGVAADEDAGSVDAGADVDADAVLLRLNSDTDFDNCGAASSLSANGSESSAFAGGFVVSGLLDAWAPSGRVDASTFSDSSGAFAGVLLFDAIGASPLA